MLCVLVSCNVFETIETGSDPDNAFYSSDGESSLSHACDMGSGCHHWYNIQDASSLYTDGACATPVTTDAQTVRCIKDLTGNSDITRSAGNTGSYTQSDNGISYLGDTGSQAAFVDIDPLANQTWFIVLELDNTPTGGTRAVFGNGSSGPTNESRLSFDTSNNIFIQWAGGSSGTASSPLTLNQKYVITLVADGINLNAYLNGAFIQSVGIGGTFETATDMGIAAFYYGSVANGSNYTLYELVVYNYTMNTSETAEVENFLRNKWGF